MNNLTKYLIFTVEFLFLKQPLRTGVGFIFGAAMKTILKILAIWSIAIQAVIAANISVWEYALLGIVLFHIPTARDILLGRHKYLSENEEKAFAMIRELKIPDYQKQAMYLKIVEKVLEKVELNPEFEAVINRQSGS